MRKVQRLLTASVNSVNITYCFAAQLQYYSYQRGKSPMSVSISQIKAARMLLGWTQLEMSVASGVSERTIRRLEAADVDLGGQVETIDKIVTSLEQAGVKFIDDNQTSAAGGPGVRLSLSPKPEVPSSETVQYPENTQPDAPTGAGG
jgi:transcriptional regulator with XRE-family HTH domain